jgi:hypothetical protein
MSTHKFPQLMTDEEAEATDELLADFEIGLHRLIDAARKEAEETGGEFRGPGILAQMNRLLLAQRL